MWHLVVKVQGHITVTVIPECINLSSPVIVVSLLVCTAYGHVAEVTVVSDFLALDFIIKVLLFHMVFHFVLLISKASRTPLLFDIFKLFFKQQGLFAFLHSLKVVEFGVCLFMQVVRHAASRVFSSVAERLLYYSNLFYSLWYRSQLNRRRCFNINRLWDELYSCLFLNGCFFFLPYRAFLCRFRLLINLKNLQDSLKT